MQKQKSERRGSLFVSSFANQTKRMRKLEDNSIANCDLTKTLNPLTKYTQSKQATFYLFVPAAKPTLGTLSVSECGNASLGHAIAA
ncbi:hypothetical protein AN944_02413 [Shewanella sp. P1-14-1]|nr:hypothetical protein AN944_02413 [Shewanella sp. P1-14-1]